MTVSTPTAPVPPIRPTPSHPSRDDLLSDVVARTVAGLQRRYREDEASAVSVLARLRRAVTVEPGADPSVWATTLGGLPASLAGGGDAASPYEWAAHTAITLFAVHQQSQRQAGMHRAGQSLGTAVRLLAGRATSEDAVRRRFHALGTASSRAEAVHHLRGLVTQLRGEGIALDYGRLAQDLRRLQDPRAADGVRLRWGRDYHRGSSDTTPEIPADDPADTLETPGDQ